MAAVRVRPSARARLWTRLWLGALAGAASAAPDLVRIVGLFDPGDERQEITFLHAVDRVNREPGLLPGVHLQGLVERVPLHNSFQATRRVCLALERGVAAVFGPQTASTSWHVQSICDAMEVPHVESRWDFRPRRADFSINIHPHPSTLSNAYVSLIRQWHWHAFTIVYEDAAGLLRLQAMLQAPTPSEFSITIRQLPPQSDDFRPLLKRIKKNAGTKILLDCRLSTVPSLLRQARELGMMNQYFSYLITSLDVHIVDLDEFKYTGANITALRLVNPSDPAADDVIRRFMTPPTAAQTRETEVALIHDAVLVFARALHQFGRSLHTQSLSCGTERGWSQGSSLLNFMKLVRLPGLSGPVQFDGEGFRTEVTLAITELSKDGLTRVGTWSPDQGANYTRNYGDKMQEIEQSLRHKTLVVMTTVNEPYAMLVNESDTTLTGNARFEGFCIDLVNEIARLREFYVQFVEGGSYGGIDPITGEASGMVKELMDQKADMAVTDLTITYEREQVLDFTMPWMNLGIGILYSKPKKEPPQLFSFLAPLSLEVWLYMAATYLGVSVLLFILARFSPYEWDPASVPEEPDVLENQFSLPNSLWFTIGSLMQQGSDIAPKALSTRMIAGLWWFFTLIMISSYTANLAAFLTVERMVSPIESAEDLAKQTEIKYGALESGSTKNFFRDSKIASYQRMWSFMKSARPSVFIKKASEGVERVRSSQGRYAYLMESPQLEYVVERDCDLVQVGGLLDTKSYGIALPPGSPYTSTISNAILILQENGTLHALKTKWWKEMKGGGACKRNAKKSSAAASELGLDQVGGVFVVLLAGMAAACCIAICEFIWKSRQLNQAAHVSTS
ncbi:LOW QUALITY PROTEIN: glutamate receptor ionotropic, kainate 2-like [Pollicipes pollicipes]|uniref:LOW QUALITY PROTEIN: glutamate receptor ionotropic, kainate 2-like n=1 Tax=Pollicipes pollicipes TaxID=41117 RepID=UPI0018849435|nr:LOW QUALITY PROTEIN: glutamate receptor ionotropic, kainate 2-like [Pollicipes pollicipes]